MAIRLDYTNMLGDVVEGGVPIADWEAAKQGFGAARAKVAALRAKGVLGFLELPGDTKLADSVTKFARAAAGKFDDVVVLGIGGLALRRVPVPPSVVPPAWEGFWGGGAGG